MDSSLILQLGIAVVVIVLIAASTIKFALRSTRTGAEPVFKANVRSSSPAGTSSTSLSPIARPTAWWLTSSSACARDRPG
jgi:hypothetical protein